MMVSVSNDAKESLLLDMKDRSHLNEKNALQRRRINGVESPLPLESINVKQQFYIKHVVFLLAAYLGGGTLCFFLIRNQIKGQKTNGILDSIYFCVVTITTIGYRNLVPDSIQAKLLACIYVFTGMALVGLFLSQAADYMIEKQEIIVVRDIYMSGSFSPNGILKEVKTNKIKYKFIMVGVLLLMLIVVGTVFLFLVEELNFMDAFYFVCSTITLKYAQKTYIYFKFHYPVSDNQFHLGNQVRDPIADSRLLANNHEPAPDLHPYLIIRKFGISYLFHLSN